MCHVIGQCETMHKSMDDFQRMDMVKGNNFGDVTIIAFHAQTILSRTSISVEFEDKFRLDSR